MVVAPGSAGGMNDFWLTVKGTAGATLLPFGCVGACLVGAVEAVDVGAVSTFGAADGVEVLAGGAGVVLLLGCLDVDRLSTGSSDVCWGWGAVLCACGGDGWSCWGLRCWPGGPIGGGG